MDQEEQQETYCPHCGKFASVRRKLLVAPWQFDLPQANDGHLSVHESGEWSHRRVSGDFINGYYCDVCDLGFVTDELLREIGLSEYEILSERYCFTPPRGTWKR